MLRLVETLICWVIGIAIGVGGLSAYANPHFEQTSGYKPMQVLIGSLVVCLLMVVAGAVHLLQPQKISPAEPAKKVAK